MADIRLVVGLGNPGREYERSRHNVGYCVVDKVAADRAAAWQAKSKFEAEVAEVRLGDRPVVLAKPTTFMNLSGRACQALLRWHKLAPVQMLVVVDDADLELGRLRVRLKGSSGGHRGLQSIGEWVGGDEYPRLRIGIGRPAADRAQTGLTGFVLGKFREDEGPKVSDAVARAAAAVECAVQRGVVVAMNEFNG